MDSGGIWPGDESYFQNIRETALQDTIEQLTKELAEARAEIERKDKLIEQMREALVDAKQNTIRLSEYYLDAFQDCQDTDEIQGWPKIKWVRALQAYKKIESALAAERGE